jgi:hypothetical protein
VGVYPDLPDHSDAALVKMVASPESVSADMAVTVCPASYSSFANSAVFDTSISFRETGGANARPEKINFLPIAPARINQGGAANI